MSDTPHSADPCPTCAPTQKGEKRRLAVIEAATELFLEQGFDNTSLDMIIERAGGSRRTIYAQFGGKDGLLVAIVDSHCQRVSQHLFGEPLSGRPLKEVLTQVGGNLLRYLINRRGANYFRLISQECSRYPELGRRFLESGPFAGYKTLGSYLAEERDAGRVELDHPELSAAQFLESVKGDLHLRLMFEPGFDAEQVDFDLYVDEAVKSFMGRVKKTCSTAPI